MFHAITQETSNYCFFQNIKWISVQALEILGNTWFIELWIQSKIYTCGTHIIVKILTCIGILIDVGSKKKESWWILKAQNQITLQQIKYTSSVRKKVSAILYIFNTFECLQNKHLIKIFWSLSGIVRSIFKLFTDHRKEFSAGVTKWQDRAHSWAQVDGITEFSELVPALLCNSFIWRPRFP